MLPKWICKNKPKHTQTLKFFLNLVIIRERQRDWFVVPLIYAFIGWYFYVAWPQIKPTISVDQDDALV